jgi:hypothetical protein
MAGWGSREGSTARSFETGCRSALCRPSVSRSGGARARPACARPLFSAVLRLPTRQLATVRRQRYTRRITVHRKTNAPDCLVRFETRARSTTDSLSSRHHLPRRRLCPLSHRGAPAFGTPSRVLGCRWSSAPKQHAFRRPRARAAGRAQTRQHSLHPIAAKLTARPPPWGTRRSRTSASC